MRALALALLLPSLALAQTTTINGPNGSGGRETAKVTATYGLQTDVTRVGGADTAASGTISAACTTGVGCGAGTSVAVAMLGKSTAGVQVTAISSPSGITLQCDISLNGGTTWSEAAAGNCQFDNSKTLVKSSTITAFAVGDSYQLVMSGGVRNVRVRASALTSGTVTVVVSATDSQDPSELFAGPVDATPPNAGAMIMSVAMADGAQTQQTAGNTGHLHSDHDGRLLVRADHPNKFACGLAGIAATLTQCAAVSAGNSYYITDIVVQTTTTTSGTYAIQQGTGANCGTGTAVLFPAAPATTASRYNAPISSNVPAVISFTTPLKATQGAAICLIGVATNTINVSIQGYLAP